jgi:hypothetical protein
MTGETANAARTARNSRRISIPRRRYTVWAGAYFALYVALPILALCLVLDFALALVLRHFGLGCLGLWCWFA